MRPGLGNHRRLLSPSLGPRLAMASLGAAATRSMAVGTEAGTAAESTAAAMVVGAGDSSAIFSTIERAAPQLAGAASAELATRTRGSS